MSMSCLGDCGKLPTLIHSKTHNSYLINCSVCGKYAVSESLWAEQCMSPVHYFQNEFKQLINGTYKNKVISLNDLMTKEFMDIKLLNTKNYL
ncbi:hypothetical protein [Spartinivicinus ruber]|uniref:hypothetical protein n=1 Tax=Spartinivicinus ruber TaxID=2683272 RepID=UPI0013D5E1CD|nr:hypothetical protein [Spartinivicinus ruber]